jgi:predicted MFS family arabinose efflux permease
VVTAALLVGIFGSAVALHRTATAAPTRRPAVARLWRKPRVMALVLGTMAIGCFFGGMQTGVTGVATAAGVAGAAGGIYAIMGVGSAITGLSCAALPARFSLAGRLLFFASTLVLCSLPLLFLSGLPAVIAVLIPLGCAVGPYLITLFSLAEREVAAEQAAGVMTLLSSGLVVGYAVGSSVGGRLADVSTSAPFAVAGLSMLAGTGVAVVLRLRTAGRG